MKTNVKLAYQKLNKRITPEIKAMLRRLVFENVNAILLNLKVQ